MSKEKFEVTVLGFGAAVPIGRRMTTSQLVNIHEKQFLVDCGEGTQTQIWKMGVRITNLNHIFISHAHGDHFFGLVPFLSSMRLMLGRSEDIHVYIPDNMESVLKQLLEAYCKTPFSVVIHTHGKTRTVLYENSELSIESIPLKHTVPCSGFLFREKPKGPVLDVDRCRELGIPVCEFKRIKNGGDYIAPDGTVTKNSELTYASTFVPRSYAFCSDTAFCPVIVPQLQNVDLLYHEATYLAADEQQALESAHSTAIQAAQMAYEANVGKLILGHFSVRYVNVERFAIEARTVFPNCIACREGMRIDVEHISEEEKAGNLLQKHAMQGMEEEDKKPETQIEVVGRLHIEWQKAEVVDSEPLIEEAVIPNGITAIRAVAFKNRKCLRRVVIPESVCSIGKSAFQGCSALSSVEIYAPVAELRDSTFKDCTSLSEIEVPEGVKQLGRWCFRGCRRLNSIMLPSSLERIGVAAFQDCISLEAIELPESLLAIKYNAFLGCSSLRGLKIPGICLVFESVR